MVSKVFIDGAAGTTGLEIRERLAGRGEFSLVRLSDTDRKDARARTAALNEADIVILCLPDEAARDAVAMIEKSRRARHRCLQRAPRGAGLGLRLPRDGSRPARAHRLAMRVSNPGCWPTGFLALVRPLVRAGLIPADFPLTVTGVSGYSGGGKSMIEGVRGQAVAALCRDGGAHLRPHALAQACAGDARACGPGASAGVLAPMSDASIAA